MTEWISPHWATEILREIADEQSAIQLVIGLLQTEPILIHVVDDPSGRPPQTPAQVRNELQSLDRQVEKLRDILVSLSSMAVARIESAREYAEPAHNTVNALAAPTTVLAGDTCWKSSSVPGLAMELQRFSSVLEIAVAKIGVKAGHPNDWKRDCLIKLIADAFQRWAPEEELSHKPSSLFYRVVDQYLEDLAFDSGNLNRTIKRLSSSNAFR